MNEQLAKALVKAVNEIPAIEKDAEGQRSPYISLDALLAKIKPVFNSNGLTVMQWPVAPQTPGNVAIETIILHESGESISRVGELPIDTNRNMSASQAAGSAYTYLKRYQLSAIGGVVSDPDIDSLPEPPRQQAAKQPQRPQPPQSPPNTTTVDARSWLESEAHGGKVTVGTLNAALRDSGHYNNVTHALNAVKLYPDFPEGYDTNGITGGTVFTLKSALSVFDWAIDRKVNEVTE